MEQAVDQDKYYTYEDYIGWNDDQHWELIDGRAYLLAAPSPEQQRIASSPNYFGYEYLRGQAMRRLSSAVRRAFIS